MLSLVLCRRLTFVGEGLCVLPKKWVGLEPHPYNTRSVPFVIGFGGWTQKSADWTN